MIGPLLDAVGAIVQWVGRNPEARAMAHERRAGFWERRCAVLRAKADAERSEQRRFKILQKAAMCFARAQHHKNEAREARKK